MTGSRGSIAGQIWKKVFFIASEGELVDDFIQTDRHLPKVSFSRGNGEPGLAKMEDAAKQQEMSRYALLIRLAAGHHVALTLA